MKSEDKRKLAAAARSLAMECVSNGPHFQNNWCGCAIGLSLSRAGLLPSDRIEAECLAEDLERDFSDTDFPASDGILSTATRERSLMANTTAVVIPLLAWADSLEDSIAEDAPQAPMSVHDPAEDLEVIP